MHKIARWRKTPEHVDFRERCPFCQREAHVRLTHGFKELDKKTCSQHFAGYEFKMDRGIVEFQFNSVKT